ncbi:hypothetical protein JTB14_036233 [Gonioctena quinquepunctata]|nr:hypothetical protein JTB14_036233 [Gonioctena quinquepunctata]
MEFLKQPASMGMCGDLGSNWRKFKNNFSLYSIATGCKEKAKEVQAAVLLHCLGEEANEVLETLDLTANDRTDPAKIIKQLDVHFLPKSNPSVETHKFNSRNQLYGESFENFLAELKKIARDCEFGTFKDRLIKDRIVSGIRDQKVKDRLLRETNLDLTKTIEICRVAEQTEQYIKVMTDKTENLEVSEIHEKNRFTNVNENSMYARRQKEKRKAQKNYVPGEYRRQLNMNSSGRDDKREQATRTANEIQDVSNKHSRTSDGGSHDSYESNCGKCGLKHRYRKCPAFGKQSSGKYLKFKLDTGAHVNVIPENIWRILKLGSLKKIKLNITNYGGQTLDVVGSYNLRVVFNDFMPVKKRSSSDCLKKIDWISSVERPSKIPRLSDLSS